MKLVKALLLFVAFACIAFAVVDWREKANGKNNSDCYIAACSLIKENFHWYTLPENEGWDKIHRDYKQVIQNIKRAMGKRASESLICDYAELALKGPYAGCERNKEEYKWRDEALAMLIPLAEKENIRAVKLLAEYGGNKAKRYEQMFVKLGGDKQYRAEKNFEEAEKLWEQGKKREALKCYDTAARLIDDYEKEMTEMEKAIYWQSFMSETDNPFDLYRGVAAYLYETGKAGIKDTEKAKYWKSKLNCDTVIHSCVFDNGDYICGAE